MVRMFARAKLLKWQEMSNCFWLAGLKMIKLDDYRAISQNFHELAKSIFFGGISSCGLFITLVFRVVWFKEQLMMHNFKIGGI